MCSRPGCDRAVRRRSGSTGRPTKYCSINCRVRATTPLTWRACSVCDQGFVPQQPTQQECSPACRLFATGKCRTARDRCLIPWGECHRCGEVIIARPNRRYCRPCRAEVTRLLNLENNWRRRALTNGGQVEKIDPMAVFDRDRWRCQLCRKPVDPLLRGTHPRAASLDHVWPLSRGGPHTEANVQLAHFGCNSRKGAR